jgi:hypothetical protein
VKTQIWIAVSVYVLVAIVRKRLKLDVSLYTLMQVFSVTVFEKASIESVVFREADLDELCRDLAKEIPDGVARAQFLADMQPAQAKLFRPGVMMRSRSKCCRIARLRTSPKGAWQVAGAGHSAGAVGFDGGAAIRCSKLAVAATQAVAGSCSRWCHYAPRAAASAGSFRGARVRAMAGEVLSGRFSSLPP